VFGHWLPDTLFPRWPITVTMMMVRRSIRRRACTAEEEIALQISRKTLKCGVMHWCFLFVFLPLSLSLSTGLCKPCRLCVWGQGGRVYLTGQLLVKKKKKFFQSCYPKREITRCSAVPCEAGAKLSPGTCNQAAALIIAAWIPHTCKLADCCSCWESNWATLSLWVHAGAINPFFSSDARSDIYFVLMKLCNVNTFAEHSTQAARLHESHSETERKETKMWGRRYIGPKFIQH